MTKERIFNFNKMLMETSLYMQCGQETQGEKRFAEANAMILKDTMESITPMSNQTAPYVIASLRTIADMLEARLSEEEKKPIKVAERFMRLGTLEVTEEETNETDNEEPCK